MKKLIASLKNFEDWLSIILLGIMVVLVFLSAIGRAVGLPNPWSVEFAQILFTWFTFSSASAIWRRNCHVSVDVFFGYFPKKLQIVCEYISLILAAIFLAYISIYSAILAVQNYERQLSAIPISYSWITISVAIFGAVMFITTICRLYRKITGKIEVLDTDLNDVQGGIE